MSNKTTSLKIFKLGFIIIAFLSFIGCEKNPFSRKEKFFDSQNLSLLELEDVGSFWNDDTVKHVSDYMGANFEDHPEFLEGISFRCDRKGIIVSVIKSQATAINVMEVRRNNVACLIQLGANNEH